MKTHLLITGGNGFVAREISASLSERFSITALSRDECDVTDEKAVRDAMRRYMPDAVIHTAAMVDKVRCELFPETARKINAEGTRVIAEACAQTGIKFVYISSDFIFDGSKNAPYHESDHPAPLNIYGKTKATGEQYALKTCPGAIVARTSRLFGTTGHNFISMLPELLAIESTLNVADDVMSSITFTEDFAKALGELISNNRQGVFHIVNKGQCTTSDFASRLSGILKSGAELNHVSHRIFLPGVDIPRYCVLESERGAEAPEVLLRSWEDASTVFISKVRHG